MITERTLRKWRMEALKNDYMLATTPIPRDYIKIIDELNRRILRLTQELLDQHLLRK